MTRLLNFVNGLPVVTNIKRLLSIYCDNNSIVLYSNNNKSSTRSEVIDIKYMIVKERIKKIKIFVEHIEKDNMLTDPLING